MGVLKFSSSKVIMSFKLLCFLVLAVAFAASNSNIDCYKIESGSKECEAAGCVWSHWGCIPNKKTLSMTAAVTMNVTVINNVGKPMQIREVVQGKKGGTICALPNKGQTCTNIKSDWIASATDGTWDSGDIFSQWWGDDTWKTAVAKYDLEQGTGSYVKYIQVK